MKKAKLKPKTTTTTKNKNIWRLSKKKKEKCNIRKERGGLKAHIFRF